MPRPLGEHARLRACEQRPDQSVARREVIVQGGDAVAGLRVDGAQRDRIDAALGKQPLRGVHDRLAPGLLLTGSRQRRLTFHRHGSRLELIT